MKKIRYWRVFVILLGCALLGWMLIHAQGPVIVPPFATTPVVTAFSTAGANAGYVLFGRHLNGTYDNGTVSLFSPHSWVTGAATLASFMAEGVGNLIELRPDLPTSAAPRKWERVGNSRQRA